MGDEVIGGNPAELEAEFARGWKQMLRDSRGMDSPPPETKKHSVIL